MGKDAGQKVANIHQPSPRGAGAGGGSSEVVETGEPSSVGKGRVERFQGAMTTTGTEKSPEDIPRSPLLGAMLSRGEPRLLLMMPINKRHRCPCRGCHVAHQLYLQSPERTEPTTPNSPPAPLLFSSRDSLLEAPPPAAAGASSALSPLLPSSQNLWTAGSRRTQAPTVSDCWLSYRAWHGAWHTSATGMNDSQGTRPPPPASSPLPISLFLSIPSPNSKSRSHKCTMEHKTWPAIIVVV